MSQKWTKEKQIVHEDYPLKIKLMKKMSKRAESILDLRIRIEIQTDKSKTKDHQRNLDTSLNEQITKNKKRKVKRWDIVGSELVEKYSKFSSSLLSLKRKIFILSFRSSRCSKFMSQWGNSFKHFHVTPHINFIFISYNRIENTLLVTNEQVYLNNYHKSTIYLKKKILCWYFHLVVLFLLWLQIETNKFRSPIN